MWETLEVVVNNLVMCGEPRNAALLHSIDFVFNNYEVNRFIPTDFTSTLCLLLTNIFLQTQQAPGAPRDGAFDCFISVINYCYVIYNNVWSGYEKQMRNGEFGPISGAR